MKADKQRLLEIKACVNNDAFEVEVESWKKQREKKLNK